jgi:cardiolipin synthase
MHLFWLTAYLAIGWLIRLGMIPIVLRRHFTPGASIAWLGIVFLHPYIGLLLYLLVGETALGPGRLARYREVIAHYRVHAPEPLDLGKGCEDDLDSFCRPVALQALKISRMPVLPGNRFELLGESTQTVDRLVADIEAASSHVHLLYYIVADDQTGRRVASALASAAGRGVKCRMLVDAFASRAIFKRNGLAERLKQQGIELAQAMPTSPLRRRDLRNHRKLAVIDDRIGYAGSQNLVNADYGGRRGAPWFDLTGRFTGPVVHQFATVFAEDWTFETDKTLDVPSASGYPEEPGGVPMQVVPTGPVARSVSYRRVALAAIQSARSRLVLTTPYFVPDEPALVSLMMAADRGVDVKLLVPAVPDHLFTAAAGRAQFQSLLDSGVGIFLYRPGLLHTKSITVDDAFAVMGSANLDVRSFNLNFELSILMYGPEAVAPLWAIQSRYLAESRQLQRDEWSRRSVLAQYADNAVALVSPLL